MDNLGKLLCESQFFGLTLRIYDDLNAVKPLWVEFEQAALLTPFQTTAWAYQWFAHIGRLENVKPLVVVASDASGILFILPLQIETGVLRKLSFLGSELCDFNCPLLAADYDARAQSFNMPDVWRNILKLINVQPSFQYDYVRLEKMPEFICGQANPMLALNTSLTPSHAYRTETRGDWETFYTRMRDSRNRYKDRYNRKKLEEIGALALVSPSDDQGIHNLVDTLIRQKSARFDQKGVSNFLLKPGYKDFYHAVAVHERDLVHVSRLNIGENAVSTNLALTFRRAYYFILNSFEISPADRYGPGKLHLRDLMKQFIEKGFTAIDFTIGDEPYKMEWCEAKSFLYDHLDASTMQGRAALVYFSAFQSTKRYIKQNPTLWNAYSKLRVAFTPRKTG